jgi:hypothetical protein
VRAQSRSISILPNHGTVLTDLLRQHSGVDVRETRDTFFLEPVAETGLSIPVGVMVRIVST